MLEATAESPSTSSSSTSASSSSTSTSASNSASPGEDFLALIDAAIETLSSDQNSSATEEEVKEVQEEGIEQGFDSEEQIEPRIKRRKLLEREVPEQAQASLDQEMEEKGEPSGSSQTCPPHPGYMWNVCIRCGQMKEASENEEPLPVPLRYIHKNLELSDDEIARLREDDLKNLLTNQKLYLVLDLDHTLLNSARFIDVPSEEESYITSTYLTGISDAQSEGGDSHRSLYKLSSLQMWTKLRPFVHKFLEKASEMYEMYVYTMGERPYALQMAKLLDPSGKYFGTRVISQGDSTHRYQKNLDVVLGAESTVVILDDTEHVWPQHKSNLIVVERYHFFGSSCRQFNASGYSLTQRKRDESKTEGILSRMLHVLRVVHQRFFDENANDVAQFGLNCKDVRKILKEIRAEVLDGCSLVFSRIFPTDFPAETHYYWKLAEELGAKCSISIKKHTTHVVAYDSGTDKSRWAIENNRFLVQSSWLEASSSLWQRQDEDKFAFCLGKDSSSSDEIESNQSITKQPYRDFESKDDSLQAN